MKMKATLVILLATFCHITGSQSDSTVPRVYSLHVNSDIKFRYARTVVSSRIANPATTAQEVSFNAILPETAFISAFTIEVDGKEYDAYVKEKEEARQEYTEAVRQGRTAAHVALSARDSNRFTVSVNVGPQKKVKFRLTYEELLSRKLGSYKHVINLDPGQIVQDLNVRVNIEESTDISSIKVPALRISNEITDDFDSGSNPLATTERPTRNSAVVKFAPTPEQQRELAADGIKGQLIVEYDVDRTAHAGEVLVRDGYFVHFFAPADLPPLRKHVTFVLDVSGSMAGRKVEQLRQAMTTILDDLHRNDLFSIILFSNSAQVWDPALNKRETEKILQKLMNHYSRGYSLHEHQNIEEQDDILPPTVVAEATLANVNKAKEFVSQLRSLSTTNMYDALMKALKIMNLGRQLVENSTEINEVSPHLPPEPIILFLTDGQPNRNKDMITTEVTKCNTGKFSVFSLALGNDADLNFLKKLSLRNSGFARKIYEASDTALQLRNFYREVASPLLANITFKYEAAEGEPEKLTKSKFRRLFFGSEIVVAGKLQANNFTGKVEGSSSGGSTMYPFLPTCPPIVPRPLATNHTPSFMERMWAYLTIQQLLEEAAKDTSDDRDRTSDSQQALRLALQYSFVTPLTSLVVVKPNETSTVGTRDASPPEDENSGSWNPPPYAQALGLAGPRGPQMKSASSSYYLARSDAQSYSSIINGDSRMAFLPGFPPQPLRPPPPPPPRSRPLPPSPPAPVTLIPLSQVSWLSDQLNQSYITLQIQNIDVDLYVASHDQPNVGAYSCNSPAGLGECRHLRYCALDVFSSNKSTFVDNYFCRINNFVGVCCPLLQVSVLPRAGSLTPPNVQRSLALVPLSNITWFNSATNNTLTLPSGPAGSPEELRVVGENEPSATNLHNTCRSPGGLGVCRHLRICTLEVFANNITEFYPQYFCRIPGNFVGVCCPFSVVW